MSKKTKALNHYVDKLSLSFFSVTSRYLFQSLTEHHIELMDRLDEDSDSDPMYKTYLYYMSSIIV